MADSILNQTAGTVPPLDTVLLWLTNTVERDFEQRGAFPRLRYAHARVSRGPATLHYLDAAEAEAVLEDSIARERSVMGGTRNAYRAHIKSVQAAMKEATERPAVFSSPEAVCVFKYEHRECWRGTKDQLKAHGFQLDGPWPHEPGGKKRWAQARHSQGYKTSVTRFSTVWPGLYEAHITIPYEVWGAKHNEKPKPNDVDLAKRNLASMLTSADDFRALLVDSLRRMTSVSLDLSLKPATWHGYTLDEDALGEIHASFDAVVEAIVGARINFDAARHAEIAQRYRAQIAATDQEFQTQLETLVRPNHRILEGGVQ